MYYYFCDIIKAHNNLYEAYYSKYAPSATHSRLLAMQHTECAAQFNERPVAASPTVTPRTRLTLSTQHPAGLGHHFTVLLE